VVRHLAFFAYAGIVGFVSAGVAASLFKLMTSEPARFALLGRSVAGWLSSFFFCAVTGPVIIVGNAIRVGWAPETVMVVTLCVAVAALWSCCIGIVLLELTFSLGAGLA
jgi:hypothetical protein